MENNYVTWNSQVLYSATIAAADDDDDDDDDDHIGRTNREGDRYRMQRASELLFFFKFRNH